MGNLKFQLQSQVLVHSSLGAAQLMDAREDSVFGCECPHEFPFPKTLSRQTESLLRFGCNRVRVYPEVSILIDVFFPHSSLNTYGNWPL